jgi:hypothetical protein
MSPGFASSLISLQGPPGTPDHFTALPCQPSQSRNRAGCLRRWHAPRSEIKEEAAGRETFAERDHPALPPRSPLCRASLRKAAATLAACGGGMPRAARSRRRPQAGGHSRSGITRHSHPVHRSAAPAFEAAATLAACGGGMPRAAKSRRRPQAGGHSRSGACHRRRPPRTHRRNTQPGQPCAEAGRPNTRSNTQLKTKV